MNLPPTQTSDDLKLVKRYVLSEKLVDALDHDINTITSSSLKQSKVLIAYLQAVQDHILVDITKLKSSMRSSGIKVYEQSETNQSLKVLYVCRGYHHEMTILSTVFNPALERLLSRYIQARRNDDGQEA